MANLGKGDLSCVGKCCRNMLFAFNALFLVCGLMATALGLFIVVFPVSYHVAVLMDSKLYYVAGFLLIICGLAVIVVVFLGYCGAKYENKSLLGGYFFAILFIFILEFIAGILGMAFYMQYECCGYLGNTTEAAVMYSSSLWYATTTVRVPESCCSERNEEIISLHKCQDRTNIDWYTHVNNQGCYDKVFNTAIQYSTILAGVGITLSLVQLFGMVFSFCLFRSL